MEGIQHDLSSDFLDNEKFDFDLAFSPNINQTNEPQNADDEEVFFGSVGFTEQCLATRAKTLQEENNIKPLSPLTGEQVVEVFKEATKVALRLEKLSSIQSADSTSTSSISSLSNSILKLSSVGSESPCWLSGKLSSGSSEGTNLSLFDLDFDKENAQPLSMSNENFSSGENKHIASANKSEQIAPAIFERAKGTNCTDGKTEQNGNFGKADTSISPTKNEKHVALREQLISKNPKKNKTDQNDDICREGIKENEENLNVAKNKLEASGIMEKLTFPGKQVNAEKGLKKEVTEQDGMKEMKSNKIPIVRARGSGLPRPGLKNSRLPKSKNTEKSLSAFNSPIRSTGSSKKRDDAVKNSDAMPPEKPNSQAGQSSSEKSGISKPNSQAGRSSSEKSGTSKASNSKMQKSVPAHSLNDGSRITSKSTKTLAKRQIFNSSESLDKLGTKDSKSIKPKLPVCGSQIPGPRPRRRRSISLSSLDSIESSTSSQTSQDDNTNSKLIRPSTKIPTTKGGLACSFGAVRRFKLQGTTVDKKPQPLKALPRPGFASSSTKNSKADTKPAKAMPPPSKEQVSKDDKIPMAATPRSSSSLPVARRRSSFKSSLSSTSSREGSPPKYSTPRKPAGKIIEPRATSSTCKRRSSNPTPTRSAPSSASRQVLRSSWDENILLSLSPASKPKCTRKTNRKLIPDSDPSLVHTKSQTIDDLLDCDNTENILEDVVPIQPKPLAQADLIDLSGL